MEALIGLLILHFCLFVVAVGFILKSALPTKQQKLLQVIFSICLPLIGPLVTLSVHISDRMKPGKPSDRYMGQTIDECPYVWYYPY